MPKLLMTSAGKTRQVDLKPNENTLGRGNDVVLHSTFARRQHAVIVVGSAFTTIRDLQSLNGTFVNGVRVETQVLAEGDVVHLGAVNCGSRQLSRISPRSRPRGVVDPGSQLGCAVG